MDSYDSAPMPTAAAATARKVLDCRATRRAAKHIRAVALGRNEGPASCAGIAGKRGRVRAQRAAYPSAQVQPLIPLRIQTVPAHLASAARLEHPAATAAAELPADAAVAVEVVAATLAQQGGAALIRAREAVTKVLRRVARDLRHVTESLEPYTARHIRAMPQRVHVAFVYALGKACEAPDPMEAALGFVTGFDPVGDITPSGWWPIEVSAAEHDLAEQDHAAWTRRVEDDARRLHLRGDGPALWAATLLDVEKGLMHGPFSRADLDAKFGAGVWRPMLRFGVLQANKLRPCDNARASMHNAGTSTFEKLVCDTPDFSARVCMAFYQQAQRLRVPAWRMAGGTDDLADAYRHVPCSDPRFTCVTLAHPETGEPVYFTLPGFNFGLKSAVLNFNRFPEMTTAVARRVLAVVCTHFYDDFACVEPAATAASAQRALAAVHELIGFPFAERKHVPAAAEFVFLGVLSDLSDAQNGHVTLSVTDKRKDKICGEIAAILDDGGFPPSVAAHLCGKLQFALSWVGGRIGRACMQPLFTDRSGVVTGAVRASLQYLLEVVPDLPPHRVRLARATRPPVLIFSDGACEDNGATQTVGFLVAVPRDTAPPVDPKAPPSIGVLEEHYDLRHGGAALPEDLSDALVRRRQQIGQVEIIGAMAPYLSLPHQLAGADIIHFIDNTSALAALTKGYSGVPDSARLVHTFHAWAAGSGANVWFEYVPSAPNSADEPSRVLSLARGPYSPAPGLTSRPCKTRFPQLDSLGSPGEWLRAARRVEPA